MTRAFRLVAPVSSETDLYAAVTRGLDPLQRSSATWTTFPVENVELTGQPAAKPPRRVALRLVEVNATCSAA